MEMPTGLQLIKGRSHASISFQPLPTMRVLGLTLILATLGLVAAQNSTASDDAYQCAFQCGELAGRDHQAAAQQCAKETDTCVAFLLRALCARRSCARRNKATACLCNTPDLINEVDACMRQTCPSAVPALEAQCRAFVRIATE